MKLKHEKFGDGALKNFLGKEIVVRFGHGDETLPFPQSFEGGLKTTNKEDAAKIEEIAARWKAVNDVAEERDTAIHSDPRVDEAKAYDERKRKEKEEDARLAEEKKQKKQAYKQEAERASEEAAAKKMK